MDQPKPPVSRGALERVLARAAELQSASGDESERQDALTEAQVLDLGKEVGLSPEHIRQALAEERVRIELPGPERADNGVALRLFGAARIVAQRVVPGAPMRVLATIDTWMQHEEWLRVMRQREDRIVWEPRGGLLTGLKRAFGARAYALHRASHVSATVVPVDQGFSLVRLEADFTVLRRAMVTQTVATAAVSAVAAGTLFVLGFMFPVLLVPVAGIVTASYVGARRSHRASLERALLSLEQVLDRLERGETRSPSLLGLIDAVLPPGTG